MQSINELLNDENNSETEIRVGFVAAASLVLIIDFAIDLLVSFARYGWAFITSLLKVCVCASLVCCAVSILFY